jgi:hypothetical protein
MTTLTHEIAELNAIDKAAADGIQKLVEINNEITNQVKAMITSDGSTALYYELPPWARELADLIRYKRMNGSQAEMFRALYRGSQAAHSDEQRQAKKLLAYAVDEVVRTHFPEESFAGYRTRVFEAIFDQVENKNAAKERAVQDYFARERAKVFAPDPKINAEALKKIQEELSNAYEAAGDKQEQMKAAVTQPYYNQSAQLRDYRAFQENCELAAQALEGSLPHGWQGVK